MESSRTLLLSAATQESPSQLLSTQRLDWSDSNKSCLPTFGKSVHFRDTAEEQSDARALSIRVMMMNKQQMAACLSTVY